MPSTNVNTKELETTKTPLRTKDIEIVSSTVSTCASSTTTHVAIVHTVTSYHLKTIDRNTLAPSSASASSSI